MWYIKVSLVISRIDMHVVRGCLYMRPIFPIFCSLPIQQFQHQIKATVWWMRYAFAWFQKRKGQEWYMVFTIQIEEEDVECDEWWYMTKGDFVVSMYQVESGSNQGRSGSSGAVKFCNCHSNNMTVVETVVATNVAAASRCKKGAWRYIKRCIAEPPEWAPCSVRKTDWVDGCGMVKYKDS